MMKLIIFGPPGAGKGTHAEILCDRYGIPKISTGDALRAVVRSGSELGNQIKSLLDEGKFVSDELVTEILRDRLASPDCANGFILDGFPRNLRQAEALEELGVQIDKTLLIRVPDEVLVARVQGRRVCETCGMSFHVTDFPPKVEGICDKCGAPLIIRTDDRPETVRARLVTYHEQTDPVVGYYRERGLLREVDSAERVEDTAAAIRAALEG